MRVRGSMETVPGIEVNVDTVYVRSKVIRIEEDEFKGWEYDEIQYGKNEYIELITEKVSTNQGAIDYILMNF